LEYNKPEHHNTTISESELKNIRTLNILNTAFVIALILDSILCALTGRWYFMYSSLFLLCGLLLSKIALSQNKNEFASLIVAISFYIAAVYHALVLDNLMTSYFILLCAPIILVVLLNRLYYKIWMLLLSVTLFFVCNFLAGVKLFDNYFFFIGLFPCFFAMLYFYNRLEQLTKEKNELIKQKEESNKEKILYAQMMSHDLKAPLRTICGFSQLLQKKAQYNEKDKQMFTFIIKATISMESLINDLLDYSKADSNIYKLDKIYTEDLLKESLSIFSLDIKQEKLQIETKNLSNIWANKEAIVTVLQNLISNSLKYKPLDDPKHLVKINIEQKEKTDFSEIIFKDNGVGIEKENIPHLFKPFKRFHTSNEYEGTGLGLSICKKILQKHNGDIEVLHSNDFGTTFVLRFPQNKYNTIEK